MRAVRVPDFGTATNLKYVAMHSTHAPLNQCSPDITDTDSALCHQPITPNAALPDSLTLVTLPDSRTPLALLSAAGLSNWHPTDRDGISVENPGRPRCVEQRSDCADRPPTGLLKYDIAVRSIQYPPTLLLSSQPTGDSSAPHMPTLAESEDRPVQRTQSLIIGARSNGRKRENKH